MNRSSIEARALTILDRVAKRQPIEDDGVELKREWVEPKEAARHLAAHANCMHGEPILWLVGVDERHGTVPGADANELSNWHSRAVAQFCEGVAPDLAAHVNVPFGSAVVPALYFLTDRAPYVVTNPIGGAITFEVPWREANATRSAKRSQLLRMLQPILKNPDIELLAGQVNIRNSNNQQSKYTWYFVARMFVTPMSRDRIVMPLHRCQMSATATIVQGITKTVDLSDVSFDIDKSQGTFTGSELIIDGPTAVTATGCVHSDEMPDGPTIAFALSLTLAGADRPCRIDLTLERCARKEQGVLARWSVNRL